MNNIAAALIFFTRLPFWRIFKVSDSSFKQVINYWAVVGWLTAPVMVIVLYLSSLILPTSVSIILAILSRLLITGALHEDGLADFFDGFGGGLTKERILGIMKDSHIGTYGVLGLVLYFLLLYTLLSELQIFLITVVVLAADPCSKFIASLMTLRLPYARNEETSKSKMVYKTMSLPTFLISAVFGLLPTIAFLPYQSWVIVLLPIFVFLMLTELMKRKIQGYTGDCCGATFLLCELSFYLGFVIFVHSGIYESVFY